MTTHEQCQLETVSPGLLAHSVVVSKPGSCTVHFPAHRPRFATDDVSIFSILAACQQEHIPSSAVP